MIKAFAKVLSANDVGSTGGHQSGLLVPRKRQILSFFPSLDETKLNPRAQMQFLDDSGDTWDFAFIYYNNRQFGGTRNEYRLTRMTKYIRQASLVEGDEIVLHRSTDENYNISYRRMENNRRPRHKILPAIVWLAPSWKAIDIVEGNTKGGTNVKF